MPQMMPINWILLFIFFILSYMLFNIMNYYIFLPKNKNNYSFLSSLHKKNFTWKW